MTPTFCPYPACEHHHDTGATYSPWWIHAGFHMTAVVGNVPRFKCLACGRTFSVRTFRLDFYTKRAISYKEIAERVPSGESVSAIARNLRCSPESVQNRIDRLGRNCVAAHESLLKGHALSEDLVADGFESFDRSQFFPNNINILVGKESQFVYAATHVTIRRKGAMTAAQKVRRNVLETRWKAPKSGTVKSFRHLVSVIPELWDQTKKPVLDLATDEHKAYPHGIRRIAVLDAGLKRKTFRHQTYSSKLSRTVHNPLFSVNYIDRELRKDIAAYHRESTCFCRNAANGRMRFAMYQTWHNYLKQHRIKPCEGDASVHAEKAGISQSRIKQSFRAMFRDRAFLSKSNLSREGRRVWLKRTPTPLKIGQDWIPKYQQAEIQAS